MLRTKTIKKLAAIFYYNFYYQYKKRTGTRVLIYHAFGSRLAHDSYGISINPELFEKHVLHIKRHYDTGWIDNKAGGGTSDKIKVLITIDDGYEDTMRAAKILSENQMPFVLFVTTGLVGRNKYLNKGQIRELASLGLCRLGTHCVDHVKLPELSQDDQNYQLEKSKKDLEDIIQNPVNMMSLPYGQYNQQTLSLIRKNNYEFNYSSRIGFNDENDFNPYLIKRFEIIASDQVCDLDQKTLGYYDYLAMKHNLGPESEY